MHKLALYLLWAFVATIPLNSALNLGAVGSANKFIGLGAGGAWIALVLARGRFRHLTGFHVVLLSLMFWALLSLVFWSEADGIAPVQTVTLLALMGVML